eukprot:1918218-Pyramimonas_sp.AAC.1
MPRRERSDQKGGGEAFRRLLWRGKAKKTAALRCAAQAGDRGEWKPAASNEGGGDASPRRIKGE